MNTDGTGWSATQRTSSLYAKYVPQLQAVGSKIYYVWCECEGSAYAETDCNTFQIWTATMNTDGTGWSATQRTSFSYRKKHPQLQVVDNKIHYVWRGSDGSYYQIWTATMNTDGTGWSATQRTSSSFGKYDPQFQVVDKIYYVWDEWDGSYYQIWTGEMILNQPPTASIICNPGLGCDTVGCVAYQNCNFSFINSSSDPNGREDIVRSEWDIYGYGNDPDEPFSGSNALNPFYLPTMPAVPSGTYTVELYIEDSTGLSSATTTTVQVKRDVSADFMCSRDNVYWTNCRTFYTRIFEGQKIYFKDSEGLSRHSSPSEGASIISRTWEIGLPGSGNLFAGVDETNPWLRFTDNTQISLTVKDDAGREDSKSYIVNVMVYSHMRYEEAKPLPL